MFAKTKTKFEILTITLILVSGVFVFSASDAKAAAGIFKQINFQGKVVNKTAGTNVANGNYDFTFVLYDAASGGATLWTETRTGANQVAVTDGIFQVNLGSVTALPATATLNVDNLYLGINFAGDGEMTTRMRFTAAPYAFNADNANALAGGTWAAPGAIGGTTAAAGTFTNLSTTTGGLSIAAGQSYTGAGAVTLSSTTNGLTLNSGNNTLTVDSTDTALTASGVTTLTLGANTTITNASGNISLQAAGVGTANIQIGDGGTTSATPDLFILDIGSAEPTGTIGAMYYSTALAKFRCYQGVAWADCIGVGGSGYATIQDEGAARTQRAILNFIGAGVSCVDNAGNLSTDCTITGGGSSDLQTTYNSDADGTNANIIMTATDGSVVMQNTTGTQFQVTMASATAATVDLASILNSGASQGAATTGVDGLQIDFANAGAAAIDNAGLRINTTSTNNNAGSFLSGLYIAGITPQANSYETAIRIGAGWDDILRVDATTANFDLNNAANSTLNIVNDGAGVASLSVEAGGSYTGAGAVTLSSAAGAGLTINSGTVGAISIGDDASNETINFGTGAAIKTLNIGSLNSSSVTTIQSGTAGITLQVAGAGTTGTVQIGAGTGANETPDLLSLDSKLSAGDPAGTVGDMYYNVGAAKFRCFEGAAWKDCDTGGAGGSPAGSDTQVQYNNAGTFGADAGFSFNSATQTLGLNGTDAEINMKSITNEPSAPASGTLTWYSKVVAGRVMPKWKAPSGVDTSFQSSFGFNRIAMVTPSGTGTTVPQVWGTTITSVGNLSHPALAATSFLTATRRFTLTTSATAAGTLVSSRAPATMAWRGNVAGLGGFFFTQRFSLATLVAGNRAFVGLSDSTAAPTNVDPTTSTTPGKIGLAINTNTGNWNWVNNITGTAPTVTALGANFPINITDMYELVIFSAPNGSNITYRVTNLSTGAQTNNTTVSANIPAAATFMVPVFWMTNNATVGTVAMSSAGWYLESDQ
ncbi:MAG: hypothetical protein HGA36_01245 [Candidatus Moranbacteria bacterium]|nr:hypothetical protein [Candidatus Moranbacteria bacterium]